MHWFVCRLSEDFMRRLQIIEILKIGHDLCWIIIWISMIWRYTMPRTDYGRYMSRESVIVNSSCWCCRYMKRVVSFEWRSESVRLTLITCRLCRSIIAPSKANCWAGCFLLLLYSSEINISEHLTGNVLTCPVVMRTSTFIQPPGHGLSDVGDLSLLIYERLTAKRQSPGKYLP